MRTPFSFNKLAQRRWAPLGLGLLMTSGLALTPTTAMARGWNEFDVCVTELKRNGVTDDAAAAGCSQAIIPKEMSQCVGMISSNTNISGMVALQSCFQVRRPIDLGNCVVDINRGVSGRYRAGTSTTTASTSTSSDSANADGTPDALATGDVTMAALQTCRQSLLPGRHSECVLALSRDLANFTPIKAMATCLAAEDFPRDLFPAYSEEQTPGTTFSPNP